MADFTYDTDAEFDAGTKSSTETATNNPLITTGCVWLAPTHCDRWAGGSRAAGWTEDNDGTSDCVDETGQLKVYARDHTYGHLQRTSGAQYPYAQCKVKFPSGSQANSWGCGVAIYWDVDNWVRTILCNSGGTIKYQWTFNNSSTITYGETGSLSAGTWYWLKIEAHDDGSWYSWYSTDGSTWTFFQSGTSPSSATPTLIYGTGYSDNPTYSGADFDNDYASPGTAYNWYLTDVAVTPNASSGSWTSTSQTLPAGKRIANLAVTTATGTDADNYVDKIEILRADDSTVVSTYSGDITSATTTTLYAANFDNGFPGPGAYKYKIYFVGDGEYDAAGVTKFEGTYSSIPQRGPLWTNPFG